MRINPSFFLGTRPSSTTTRIKTKIETLLTNSVVVRDHLPLQQGLKRDKLSLNYIVHHSVRDHRPLQQGLRQILKVCSM